MILSTSCHLISTVLIESVLTVSIPLARLLISQVIWSPFFRMTTSVFSRADSRKDDGNRR